MFRHVVHMHSMGMKDILRLVVGNFDNLFVCKVDGVVFVLLLFLWFWIFLVLFFFCYEVILLGIDDKNRIDNELVTT